MLRYMSGAIPRQSHLTYALEYGALLMDINIDRLALRCFSTASCSGLSEDFRGLTK